MKKCLSLFAADADQWEEAGMTLKEEDDLILAFWRWYRGRPCIDGLSIAAKVLYSSETKRLEATEAIREARRKAGKMGASARWGCNSFANGKANSKPMTEGAWPSAPSTASAPTSPLTTSPNINRSVPVPADTPNGNGTGLDGEMVKMPGGLAEAKRRGHDFCVAVGKDQGAFFDPEFDPITICATVTGDWKSLKRWRQLVIAKGDAAVREEVFTFYREICAGEDVDNRGAVLNKRLGLLHDQKQTE